MKSATVGGNKPKGMGGVYSPRKKEVSGTSPQMLFQGLPRKIKGPLKPRTEAYKNPIGVMVGVMGRGKCPTSEN